MPRYEHSWEVSEAEARQIQTDLAGKVQKTNGFDPATVKTIAGIDCSLKDEGQAAVVVLSFPELEVVEKVIAVKKLTFPYIPGLLSFREVPVVLAALEKLKTRPDLLIVDGQGYAHPRRFGIACHLGVFTDTPSIGCAKSKLWGTHGEVGAEPGAKRHLRDYKTREIIGMAVRTKVRSNPLIISLGHLIDLPTSVDFVEKCLRGYRLPEPTRAAHNFAGTGEPFPERHSKTAKISPEVASEIADPPEQGTLF